MKFYIGQKVVVVRNTEYSWYKIGEIYTVKRYCKDCVVDCGFLYIEEMPAASIKEEHLNAVGNDKEPEDWL